MSDPLAPDAPPTPSAHSLATQLAVILGASHEAGVGMDADGCISHWNHVAEVTFGWSAGEVIGRRLADVLIPEHLRAAHDAGIARFHATGEGPYLNQAMMVQALHRDSRELRLRMTLAAVPSDDRTSFIAFLQEERREQLSDQALIEQALQDPLTGLDNRRAFMENLAAAMKRSRRSRKPMALMYMDIDHFKSINDGLGHSAGDALLQSFGARLRAAVRETDRVARLGGDEFTVILEMLNDGADAERVASKILLAMTERFDLPDRIVRITTSIGLEIFDGGDVTADQFISHADQAMYRAKRSGRNTWRLRGDTTAPKTDSAEGLQEFIGRSPAETSTRNFLDNALAAVRSHLGMEVAFISEFVDGQRIFRHVDSASGHAPIAVGDGDPLDSSYCQRVVDGRLPEIIPDTFELAETLALAPTRELPVRAHLSVPIHLSNGGIYGTFCCFSSTPDASLNERDIAMLRIFAELAARHIEQHG